MPQYRDLNPNFADAEMTGGKKVFPWETLNLSALYDLRDALRASNATQSEILRVLRRMERRMAKHMPLK